LDLIGDSLWDRLAVYLVEKHQANATEQTVDRTLILSDRIRPILPILTYRPSVPEFIEGDIKGAICIRAYGVRAIREARSDMEQASRNLRQDAGTAMTGETV